MAKKMPDVAAIAEMDKKALVELWVKLFGSPPMFAGSREFLQHIFAEHIQGGVPLSLQRKLDKLTTSYKKSVCSAGAGLSSGTIIVKTWHGQKYSVTVTDDGFVFQGTTYSSLTKIAREITGTAWNGPAFFGLRK